MEKAQVRSVLALHLEKVPRKGWTRRWVSRRKSEGVFFTIFQELMKEDSDGLKGSFWLRLLNFISCIMIILDDSLIMWLDF